MKRAVIAMFVIAGCERASPTPVPPPTPDPSPPMKVRYAATTEKASDGTNDNYFSIDDDQALFVVADAVTARSGVDPSKRAADEMSAAYENCGKGPGSASPLICAIKRVSQIVVDENLGTTALAAATWHNDQVWVSAFGAVAVVRVRGGKAELLDTPSRDPLGKPIGDVHLLPFDPRPGDTVALLNHDLFAALGLAGTERFLAGPFPDADALERAAKAMTAEASRTPKHGPMTVVLFSFVVKPALAPEAPRGQFAPGVRGG